MNKIDLAEKKLSMMVDDYNEKYEGDSYMANDLLDIAEGIMGQQSRVIKLHKENSMAKIRYIQENMNDDETILVRSEGKSQWFIHLLIHETRTTIHKAYVTNLDAELDKVIDIIKKRTT